MAKYELGHVREWFAWRPVRLGARRLGPWQWGGTVIRVTDFPAAGDIYHKRNAESLSWLTDPDVKKAPDE